MNAGTDLAILAALREELQAVWPLLKDVRRVRLGSRSCHMARAGFLRIVVAKTGIGPRSAAESAEAVLAETSPRRAILFGFAGGLAPELRTGDVVVAAQVLDRRDDRSDVPSENPAQKTWEAPADLLELARSLELGPEALHAGRLVTVSRACASASEKRALGELLAALAVDMESAAVAEACSRHQVPLLCLRAILDEADHELPFDFDAILTPSGRPRPLRLLGAAARNPRGLLGLAELRRLAHRSRERLRATLAALLGRWPELG